MKKPLVFSKKAGSGKSAKRNLLFFFCFIPAALLPAGPPNLRFKHLTLRDGLSQSHVQCIIRDTLGFMWFGTEDGLNRFDGYGFRIYRHDPDDETSLASSHITAMVNDRRGRLWIGTAGGGLNRYDRERDRFVRYKLTDPDSTEWGLRNIRHMIVDREGGFWIGYDTGGLVHFDPETGHHVQYKNSPDDPTTLGYDDVWAVCEDSRGRIWAGTMGGGVSVFDRGTETFTRYTHDPKDPRSLGRNEVWCIYADRRQTLWIGTYGGGLARYDAAEDIFTTFTYDPDDPASLGDDVVFSLLEDDEGRLWVGTENGGLNLLDREAMRFHRYTENPNTQHGLSHNSVECLYADPFGTLWLGTYYGGVNYTSPFLWKFMHYGRTQNPGSLSNNSVTALIEDRKGDVWIGTDGGGLNRFDRQKEVFEAIRRNNAGPGLSSDMVLSLHEDAEGRLWIGTFSGGLNRWDRRTGRWDLFSHDPNDHASLSGNDIRAIHEDSRGLFWVGTSNGLNRMNRDGTWKRYAYDSRDPTSLSHNAVYVIHEDRMGWLWFGTYGRGLNLYDHETDSFVHFLHHPEDGASLGNNFIFSMAEDSRGRLWIGTGGGLDLFDRASRTFSHFRAGDGLPNDVIKGILEDDAGTLWISTNNGLTRFRPDESAFQQYTIVDGLQSNEFNPRACLKTRRGDLYFGGVNGFNVFRPEAMVENPYPPPVLITDFTIFNQPVLIGTPSSPLKKHISLTEELILSHDHSVITFDFVALNYILPEKNRYRFILEGFEENWNDVGGRRIATYTNLDPGKYVFRVTGSNNDQVWNENGAVLHIRITPPLWGTAWFRMLTVILGAGLILSVYYARTRAMERRNRELEEHNRRLNEEIGARIAAEALIQQMNAELESRVRRRTAELENALRELEAFSYSVSHDLRAPLRSIDGFSHILLESHGDRLDADGRNSLKRIHRATQRMSRLIDDLLGLARLTRRNIEMRPVDLSALVQEAVAEHMESLPGTRPETRIQPGLTAKGDALLLQNMMANLIGNAIKFSSRKKDPQIEFGALSEAETDKIGRPGQQVFFIRDNGAGFDMDYVDKLFRPFQRLHRQDEFDGTGVGLATVQRIIHLHGGEIWAAGEVGKGATFYFTLE